MVTFFQESNAPRRARTNKKVKAVRRGLPFILGRGLNSRAIEFNYAEANFSVSDALSAADIVSETTTTTTAKAKRA